METGSDRGEVEEGGGGPELGLRWTAALAERVRLETLTAFNQDSRSGVRGGASADHSELFAPQRSRLPETRCEIYQIFQIRTEPI